MLLWMLIWLGLIVMVICLKINLTRIVLNTRLVKMEGLANVMYTKLFPVKMICRRLPCKKLPRKTRTLIPVTRWGGFGKNSHRSKSLAVVMTDKLYARRF